MRNTLAFIFTFVSFVFVAQINEEFLDGDFSNNPNWTGTNSDFIVNAELKLQLNNTEAGTYVMVFEAFSTDGSVFFTQIKAFTLAGKI